MKKKQQRKPAKAQPTKPRRNCCPVCHEPPVRGETILPQTAVVEGGRRVFLGDVAYVHYCKNEHKWVTK